jgi:hypothetical protein
VGYKELLLSVRLVYEHIAKTLYRKFETNIPRNETARPRSQFPHSCLCERLNIFPQPVHPLRCSKIDGPTVHCNENSILCMPFLGIARPQSQFPNSCVFERFIFSQDRPTYFLQQNRQIDRGNI